MASAILANSPGWKLIGPMLTQMRAPLILRPTPGTQRQHQQADADQEERVAVALEVAGPAHDHERRDEGDDADRGPRRLAGRPGPRRAGR